MKGFNVLALDNQFQTVSLLRYTNLQWSRKYFEPGTFSIEIPLDQYDSSFKYIYSSARREMGIISQVNYIVQKDYKAVNLSGYFLENMLNWRIAYQNPTETNITNNPAWINQLGNAEDVAYAYFNAFKDIAYTINGISYVSNLNIDGAQSLGRGHVANHERDNTQLGTKLYTILKPSEMSYRINYDFDASVMQFEVWSGLDRTQDNAEYNNPIIFSTRYGNIKEPDILLDASSYRNSYVSLATFNENQSQGVVIEVGNERTAEQTGLDDTFLFVSTSVNKKDYSTNPEYITAIETEGHDALLDAKKTISVQFNTLESSYEYLNDFDLGDKCSIEITEIGLSCDAVLIGCYEVIKNGVNTLTLEFDTPQSIKGGI